MNSLIVLLVVSLITLPPSAETVESEGSLIVSAVVAGLDDPEPTLAGLGQLSVDVPAEHGPDWKARVLLTGNEDRTVLTGSVRSTYLCGFLETGTHGDVISWDDPGEDPQGMFVSAGYIDEVRLWRLSTSYRVGVGLAQETGLNLGPTFGGSVSGSWGPVRVVGDIDTIWNGTDFDTDVRGASSLTVHVSMNDSIGLSLGTVERYGDGEPVEIHAGVSVGW